jgi:6,7-dimethyl-8-ribityllumazine synthase
MDPETARVLIVTSRFYAHISDELEAGARETLTEAGVAFELVEVPGAFEVPGVIAMAEAGEAGFDGYVALGCVIRGETTHYDYVCGESARGLQELAVHRLVPVGYGILTVENEAQALVRARRDQKNKGRDAALACLAMIAHKRRFLGVDALFGEAAS